jgi:hypothetical protein
MRLVIEHAATLVELDTHYSIEDVASVNEALDAWAEAQASAQKAR